MAGATAEYSEAELKQIALESKENKKDEEEDDKSYLDSSSIQGSKQSAISEFMT
jgi:hypothetical protein